MPSSTRRGPTPNITSSTDTPRLRQPCPDPDGSFPPAARRRAGRFHIRPGRTAASTTSASSRSTSKQASTISGSDLQLLSRPSARTPSSASRPAPTPFPTAAPTSSSRPEDAGNTIIYGANVPFSPTATSPSRLAYVGARRDRSTGVGSPSTTRAATSTSRPAATAAGRRSTSASRRRGLEVGGPPWTRHPVPESVDRTSGARLTNPSMSKIVEWNDGYRSSDYPSTKSDRIVQRPLRLGFDDGRSSRPLADERRLDPGRRVLHGQRLQPPRTSATSSSPPTSRSRPGGSRATCTTTTRPERHPDRIVSPRLEADEPIAAVPSSLDRRLPHPDDDRRSRPEYTARTNGPGDALYARRRRDHLRHRAGPCGQLRRHDPGRVEGLLHLDEELTADEATPIPASTSTCGARRADSPITDADLERQRSDRRQHRRLQRVWTSKCDIVPITFTAGTRTRSADAAAAHTPTTRIARTTATSTSSRRSSCTAPTASTATRTSTSTATENSVRRRARPERQSVHRQLRRPGLRHDGGREDRDHTGRQPHGVPHRQQGDRLRQRRARGDVHLRRRRPKT